MGGVAAGGCDVVTIELDGLGASGAEFAEDDELGEGAGVGTFEACFGAFDEREVLGDPGLVDAEAIIVVAVGIFAVVLGLVIEDALVLDGRGDDLGPVQPPVGGDHALDQVKFGDGAGLESFEVVVLELFKKAWLSLQRTTVLAERPCLTALQQERCLPSSVMGPWDSAPLRRDASICASDLMEITNLLRPRYRVGSDGNAMDPDKWLIWMGR